MHFARRSVSLVHADSVVVEVRPFPQPLLSFFELMDGICSGHAATIYCTLGDFSYDHCHYSRRLIRVPDGGTLALDFTPAITPEDPIDSRPILVVLHG